MSAVEFQLMQMAFVYCFGDVLKWLAAFFVAIGGFYLPFSFVWLFIVHRIQHMND